MKYATELVKLLSPIAKAGGYKKNGQTWRKCGDGVILVLNVQQSRWNNWAYVNVGVYLQNVEKQDSPKEYECQLRARIEDLIPKNTPEYCEDDAGAALATELIVPSNSQVERRANAVAKFAVPFLERFSTINKVRAIFSARDRNSEDIALRYVHQLDRVLSATGKLQ